jgi:S-DNA-T family DNA segregation ATPase FtsK/SpoIIIE
MLYMATNASDKNPVRIQGAFVSDGELERVISFVRRNNAPVQYNRAFMDQIEVEMARAAKQDRKGDDFDIGDEDEGGEDPKFVEAVELSIQAQKVATSLLQRRLGVGYGRAAKIIDRMEELGLVSAAEGNKPRKILPAAQGYLEHIGAMSADDDDFGDDYS